MFSGRVSSSCSCCGIRRNEGFKYEYYAFILYTKSGKREVVYFCVSSLPLFLFYFEIIPSVVFFVFHFISIFFLSIMNILLRIGHFYPFESQLTAPLNDFILENTRWVKSTYSVSCADSKFSISQFINVGAIKSLIFGCKQVFRKYFLCQK
jgi:hypothetical protein